MPSLGRMTDQVVVTIATRFNGPPGSANGGYACGTAARALGAGTAEVTLRLPPPVGRPLHVAGDDGRLALLDGDDVIAEARATTLGDDPAPPAVSFADAQAAAEKFDVDTYRAWHPFPTCFTCGPGRPHADGLGLFPAASGDDRVAAPWVPDAGLAAADGLVDFPVVWAALDCPGGLSWFHRDPPVGPHVLGRMAATVHRRPGPGEELVAGGWLVAVDGRKRHAGAAIWGPAGEVLAESRTTWIALDDRLRARFQARN